MRFLLLKTLAILSIPGGFAAGWMFASSYGCQSGCGIMSSPLLMGVMGVAMAIMMAGPTILEPRKQ